MAVNATHRSAVLPFQTPKRAATSPIRSAYDAAVETQAQNYDDIMQGYDSLQNTAKSKSGSDAVNFTPLSAISRQSLPQYTYNRSGDFDNLVTGLQDYASTGGYSGSDINAIRERGLSPLRAAYANAQRNLARQKNLQGGYMPNAGAIYSKMAREQGELASTASTNINAEVAKMVAAGKLAGYQSLSPVLSQENQLQNTISSRNVDAARDLDMENTADARGVRDSNAQLKMRADEFNANQSNTNDSMELAALSGKTNLYGTTPALTNTFANQVLQNNAQNMQAVQVANQIKNARAGIGLNIVGAAQAGTGPSTKRGGVAVPRF